MKKLIYLLLTILIISSCVTTELVIDDSLSPAELFQLAQKASSNKKYDNAVKYYEVFIDKYSDDTQRLVEAEYEIAFINFKEGNLKKSKELFTALLDRYSAEGTQVLPAWPMILSKKLIKEIEDQSQ